MRKIVLLLLLASNLSASGIGILAEKSSAIYFDIHGGYASRVINERMHSAGNLGVSGSFFYNFKCGALEIGLTVDTLANSAWEYYSGLRAGYAYFGKNWFFRAGAGVDFALEKVEFLMTPYIGGGYILPINQGMGAVFSGQIKMPVHIQPWYASGVDLTMGVGLIFATKKNE